MVKKIILYLLIFFLHYFTINYLHSTFQKRCTNRLTRTNIGIMKHINILLYNTLSNLWWRDKKCLKSVFHCLHCSQSHLAAESVVRQKASSRDEELAIVSWLSSLICNSIHWNVFNAKFLVFSLNSCNLFKTITCRSHPL